LVPEVAEWADDPDAWAGEAQRILADWRLASDARAVDRAVGLLRRTLDHVPDGHPALGPVLANLGEALRVRFERAGRVADLDEAVRVERQAIAVVSASEPGYPFLHRMLANLAGALLLRHGRTGDVADCDEAVRTGERAVAAISATDPLAAISMSTL
jgi:hypothetical protein